MSPTGHFLSLAKEELFRAPARVTFLFYASGGLFSFSSERKEEKKRRQKLRFWISLRGFTCCLSCLFSPRERCTAEISPKCCIVSASLFAAALALKCRAVHPRGLWQDCFLNGGQRPPPTFAALRQRRDLIIAHTRRVFPKREGRSPPSLVVQGWGIFKGEGRSKLPSPLNGAFGYFCRYWQK